MSDGQVCHLILHAVCVCVRLKPCVSDAYCLAPRLLSPVCVSATMAARNAKQARSQLQPLTVAEMTQFLEFVNRGRANGQLDGLLAQSRLHVIGYDEPMSPTSDSDAGFSMVGEGPQSSGARAAPKGPPPPPGYGRKPTPSALPRGPPPPTPSPSPSTCVPGGPPPPTAAGTTSVPMNTEYAEAIATARLDVFPMPTVPKAPLAPGVPDLVTWSKTLFELPKYRELKLSYKGLLMKAWDDVNMLSYIRWIGSTYAQEARNPKAGKASDFAAYLLAVKFPAAERQKEIEGRRRTLVEE